MKTIPVCRPTLGELELGGVKSVLDSGWLGMGVQVRDFEHKVSEYLGGPQVVAVHTGTSALHLALAGLGVGPGDEVMVPSMTYAGSVQAITSCGATPVFCDIDESTLMISMEEVERQRTEKTRAVMPVHYANVLPCLDGLLEWASGAGIRVVEDAAHVFGAELRERRIGSFGDLTCFSFDQVKTLTCGEGGAVVTRDPDLAARLRQMRWLGLNQDTWSRYKERGSRHYDVVSPGFRYHMSNLNAAIGLAQFQSLERFIVRRREVVRHYDDAFGRCPSKLALQEKVVEESAPFCYILRVLEGRDRLMARLEEDGISSGIHYIPNHHHSFFQQFTTAPLAITDRVFQQIITLPLYSDITAQDVNRVTDSVLGFCR